MISFKDQSKTFSDQLSSCMKRKFKTLTNIRVYISSNLLCSYQMRPYFYGKRFYYQVRAPKKICARNHVMALINHAHCLGEHKKNSDPTNRIFIPSICSNSFICHMRTTCKFPNIIMHLLLELPGFYVIPSAIKNHVPKAHLFFTLQLAKTAEQNFIKI